MTFRVFLVLAAFWLGILVASWIFASLTFRAVAQVTGPEARPEVGEKLSGVAAADRTIVLRHLASEINRAMFRTWLVLQLVLGLVVLVMAHRTGGPWILSAVLLGLVLVQAGLYFPIHSLGQSIDFVARPLPPDVAAQFGRLHGAYVLVDLAKMLGLAALLAKLVRS